MIFTYVIEGIDSKVISVCLIDDYSLIAYLHIFVYESAECASISLKCRKVKLLLLNNFAPTPFKASCLAKLLKIIRPYVTMLIKST